MIVPAVNRYQYRAFAKDMEKVWQRL